MHPKIWGKSGWNFLHCVTLGYPKVANKDQMNQMKRFFMSVKDVLPCEECQVNFNVLITNNPLTIPILSTRKTLVLWLISLHNMTNKETGASIITVNNILKMYGMKMSDL